MQRNLKQECIAFYEGSCAGICSSESRLVPLYRDCVLNLGSAASALLKSALDANHRAPRALKP